MIRVRKLRYMLVLAIVAASVLAYVNSFSATWIFDDIHTIQKVSEGANEWPAGIIPLTERPVSDLSFLLNWYAGGTKVADYHAVNLLIHIINALLLFGLIRRLLLRVKMTGLQNELLVTLVAGACSAVWAVHPLTTAAVTYISQRYELLMSTFYLLTLYAVVRGEGLSRRVRKWGWYFVASLACLLGMGSKEVMITAPVAVAICDWMLFSDGSLRRMMKARWGLYCSFVACWVVLLFLMNFKSQQESSFYAYEGMSALQYAATQCGVVCRYLKLAFWPTDLCFDYGWRRPETVFNVLGPAMVMGVILLLCTVGIVRRCVSSWPLAMFLLVLSPTSTIVARPDPIMEHRMYLPLAALTVWAVTGIMIAVGWAASKSGRLARHSFYVQVATTVVLVVMLGVMTRSRNEDYRSDVTIWQSTVQHRPGNARAYLGLGSALFRAQRTAEAKAAFIQALVEMEGEGSGQHAYDRTVRAQAHNNLGAVYFREGDMRSAAAEFVSALKLAPDYEEAERNLNRARGH